MVRGLKSSACRRVVSNCLDDFRNLLAAPVQRRLRRTVHNPAHRDDHGQTILLALIVCDGTIREAGTNKLSLIGTFNGLFAPHFPCVHPTLSVYIALTDGRGIVPCLLRMTNLENGAEIFSLQGQVDFQDPTGIAELVFQLQQLKFECPGLYALDFLSDRNLLGTRKLRVQVVEQSGPEGQQ